MKRTMLAVALAIVTAGAYAAAPRNDQYRNNAGEADRHQPQLAQASGTASSDNGGKSSYEAPQLG